MLRLHDAAQYRVTGIVAPAGFGKTVALRQFLGTLDDAWIVDAPSGAMTLASFARAFADALTGVVPAMRTSFPTAFESVRGSPSPGAGLAAWASFHLRERRLTVAFDDLHAGDGDPEIAAFLRALVEGTSDGVRFIFSSRTAAGLPFATWTAYSTSDLVVDAEDLRLTLDEARACAGPGVDAGAVADVLARVDGWPTAFQFALRTMSRAQDIAAATDASREMVYQYLAEQVWRSLEPQLRAFLRTAAFLPRIDVRLCVAAGYDDALALIDTLRTRVTFITKLGEDTYALHELFRDFIRHDVRGEGASELARAWTVAAIACERAGRIADALEAWVRAGDRAAIGAFIAEHGLAFVDRGQLDLVERALAVLEPDTASSSPVVVALQGICAEAHGRAAEAEHRFRAALSTVGSLDVALAVDITTKIAVYHARYDRANALHAIERLLARPELDPRRRAMLLDINAVTLAFTDRIDDAIVVIREALRLVDRPEIDADARGKVHANAALVFYHAGDEAAVRRYAASAIENATSLGNERRAAAIWMNLHLMHAGAGRTGEAARCAANAVEAATRAGDFEYRGVGLRAQLKLAAERGDEAEMERLRGLLVGVPSTSRCGMIYEIIALAIALPWTGRFDEAREALQRLPDADLVAVQNRTRYALLALLAAAGGVPHEAEAALERHRAYVAPDAARRHVFERTNAISDRWIVLAQLLLHAEDDARSALATATALPSDLGGMHDCIGAALAFDRARFERGLKTLDRSGKAGLARFLDAVSAPLWHAQPKLAPSAALTKVELQVVRCLAEGLSNSAIADRHSRSVHTVRTQVASLMRKLGASSRGEATAIARRHGLVDDAP
jgi:ATP/maltotriose-dependent transcriptional regulator MalT